jgi:type IV secretion/conjugal transfer VirB4 family ATPase
MLNLQEFRSKVRGLPDVLEFCKMPEDGVVDTKSGGYMASWYFRGKDTQSATHAELASISSRLNAALCMLGEGWMLHCDAIRRQANTYPPRGAFPDPTSAIIDEERRQQFLAEGEHFETFYALTLTYFPPLTAKRAVASMMIDGLETTDKSMVSERILAQFRKVCDDFESIFSGLFPARRMRGIRNIDAFGQEYVNDEQLQYYEYCVSGINRPVRLPSIPMYLDAIIGAHEFTTGNSPRVGDQYICIVAIDGFAQESYPGVMSSLDDLSIEYRWSTRFIFHEPYKARQLLEKIRKKWMQKQRGLKDQVFNTSKGAIDLDAVNMTVDVEQAIGEAESNLVKFGNYTSVIVLMGTDKIQLADDARKVRKAIMNSGFGARIEDANAVEAFLGSIPGNHYANVRRPLLHTLNLSDLLPITSIWAGEETNPCRYFPTGSPALAYAATTGSTPFRFNLHVGDVGHSLVLGKTRGGKSTALAFMVAQWLRYPDSQIFSFDKGYSMYVLTQACGGQHYDLGGERSKLSFCPLYDIHTEVDQAMATDWVRGCMEMQKLSINAARINAIREAIVELSGSEDRSLTKFQALLQDREMREAMTPYTLKGAMGHLLDGRENTIQYSRFVTFELDNLMKMGETNYAPLLLYVFNQIERRLKGKPAFIPVDEAWLAFKIGIFKERLEEWSRTWGKKNASLLLATQNMDDALKSDLAPVLLQNFPCKVFLPNPEAQKNTFTPIYQAFGMNDREVSLIANATERRQYYYTSPLGRRLFSFGFGGVALSFIGAGGIEDIERCDQFMAQYGDAWPAEWLRSRGLADWADYWQTLKFSPDLQPQRRAA